ncbi:e1-E2 ATPase domain-containing protein [Phthorimaea operculella]|nr:e1-E2 ATPase domain-containing protein [Phthorimaea operculella]
MRAKSASLVSISELFRPSNPRGLEGRNLSSARLSLLKQEIQTDMHIIPLKDLYQMLETDPERGLSSTKAAYLLHFYGHNTLTPASQNSWWKLLLKSLFTGFSILIWLGALLCLVAYMIEAATKVNASRDNLYLGCVLIFVDVVCGLFSFFQNYKSSQIMKTFNSMIPTYTHCIRDGHHNMQMQVSHLVKGDVVMVRAGDVIPADIRVIDSKGFKVDNSSLTGECIAVSRMNTDGVPNVLESQNVAFFSSMCVEGWAKGVVLCCGDLTALGRVAGLAARLQPAPSPLSKEIDRFMRYMSAWALCLGFFIACASLALGYPFMQVTVFVIGIIVANIPEGLQPTVTASLTLTAQRMVHRNCLVKNLEAIEALGACTTICSDKTGTLTQNKMAVCHAWVWNKILAVTDSEFSSLQNNPAIVDLKRCGALCSNADFKPGGGIHGDASETAILNFLCQCNDPMALRQKYPKIAEIPFNSVNKYQVSIHLDSANSRHVLMMKGAPESLVQRSTSISADKKTVALTKDMRNVIEQAVEGLADTGERVLAFADMELDPKKFPLNFQFDTENVNFPLDNMRLLGLMGLKDPPREQVLKAIQRVRSAGIRVMMVTGDHPATARAIASEVGIATDAKCHVITGTELRNMTPDILNWELQKHYEIGKHRKV